MARSSSDGVMIRHVLPVLWMTLCFHSMSSMVYHAYPKRQEHNNQNYCTSSNRIMLNRTDQPLHVKGCAEGGGEICYLQLIFVFRMDVGSAARGELAAKTTYQRAAKGAIAVSECPPDGKCVKLENTGRRVTFHCTIGFTETEWAFIARHRKVLHWIRSSFLLCCMFSQLAHIRSGQLNDKKTCDWSINLRTTNRDEVWK